MADAKVKETTAGSHRATQRGYAGGELIEPGKLVPANTPVSEEWMEPTKKGGEALARAIDEAQDMRNDDVDLTALSKPALEAMAAERGINVKGLTKDDLITAIKAEAEHKTF